MISDSSYFVLHLSSALELRDAAKLLPRTNVDLAASLDVSGSGGGGDLMVYLDANGESAAGTTDLTAVTKLDGVCVGDFTALLNFDAVSVTECDGGSSGGDLTIFGGNSGTDNVDGLDANLDCGDTGMLVILKPPLPLVR